MFFVAYTHHHLAKRPPMQLFLVLVSIVLASIFSAELLLALYQIRWWGCEIEIRESKSAMGFRSERRKYPFRSYSQSLTTTGSRAS